VSSQQIEDIVSELGELVRDRLQLPRLWTDEEVTAMRKKRAEIEGSYAPPK
jgi:hypothetical protein